MGWRISMIKFLFTMLLNLIGIGILVVVLVVPLAPQFKNDSRVDNLMAAVLCNPGEQMVRVQSTNPLLSRFGIGMTPTCVNTQGQRRDVTTRWIIIGLGGFAFTFLFGIVLEVVLIINAIRRRIARSIMPRDTYASVPMSTPMTAAAPLKDQLRQLEDAKKAGLITFDEYDRLRSEILSKM